MSKRRRSDADAAIADLLRRNPELPAINPHLAQPAPQPHAGHAPAYQLTEAAHPAPTEHEEQVALFAWAAAQEEFFPELALLFAIPNGGYRPMATAAMLRAEGVKAGVPDCCLPVARGRFHSLWIEMKRKPNKPTETQELWIARLRAAGCMAVVCYSADEAIRVIGHYLFLDERNHA
jgi:hypothetical protein